MKKIRQLGLYAIFALCCACSRAAMGIGPLPEDLQQVRAMGTNEEGCSFIQRLYIEVRDQSLNYYVAMNTRNFGGNRYRIINTSHEMVMGVDILKVNFEIYDCNDSEKKSS